jgi:hypothetical protein
VLQRLRAAPSVHFLFSAKASLIPERLPKDVAHQAHRITRSTRTSAHSASTALCNRSSAKQGGTTSNARGGNS